MAEERSVSGAIHPRLSAPHADRLIGDLAERQHGVVARRQLLALGLSGEAIKVRVARATLLRLHRGVYAVGHRRLRREGYWMAAVLAAGPGAVLSHRDAAALHGIRPTNRPAIDVTTTGRQARRRGIDVHRVTALGRTDRTVVDGIPVTTVARTLVDLAALLPTDHVVKALGEAERLNLLDVGSLEAALIRTAGRHGRGHKTLRGALAEVRRHGVTLTRSVLEDRFRALVKAAALPSPQTNAHLDGYEVDVVWREQRVVVELDGWASHHTRRAFQRDRTKDARLALAGYTVLRFTHADVATRPRWVAATVGALLAARSTG